MEISRKIELSRFSVTENGCLEYEGRKCFLPIFSLTQILFNAITTQSNHQ